MNLLILQQRACKAGAQYALLRTLQTSAFRKINTIVILGELGWLSEKFDKLNIEYRLHSFPSSRSIGGKLILNAQFSRKTLHSLGSFSPDIVMANDHCECLLTLRIAKIAHAKTAAFLRSSELTQSAFIKYGCPKFDLLLPIGKTLFLQTKTWHPDGNIHVAYDGIEETEFSPVRKKNRSFPTHWFIVGGVGADKGWQDFAEAIRIAEKDPSFPTLTCDFTSVPPNSPQNDMKLDLPRRAIFNFLGRVPSIVESAKSYHLCVHPSQEETFGLAAAELIASGQPLLASKTGVLDHIQANSAMKFEPKNPVSQAQCYLNIFKQWDSLDLSLDKSQHLLKQQFLMSSQGIHYSQLLANIA